MFLKLVFDRGGSLFGLIFLCPVLLAVGALIRIRMAGRSCYLQAKACRTARAIIYDV